jgi:prepilin signal peptidase PulO-like enzyme (type II secretory pathway)
MFLIIIFTLGLIFGSFLNAFEWRFAQKIDSEGNGKKINSKKAKKLSIVYGRSMCPNCKHVLSSLDLITVVCWLFLMGKCRYCGVPISVQYPFVEISTAFLYVFSFFFYKANLHTFSSYISFANLLLLILGFIVLCLFDLKKFLLPSKIIYYLLASSIVLLFVASLLNNDFHDFYIRIFSSLFFGSIFYFIYRFSKGKWLGGGDVRLAFLLGFQFDSVALIPLCLFISSISGLFYIMVSNYFTNKESKTMIPFGPFLMLSCLICIFYGNSILSWYLRLL